LPFLWIKITSLDQQQQQRNCSDCNTSDKRHNTIINNID
jgi:hypothetical protein